MVAAEVALGIHVAELRFVVVTMIAMSMDGDFRYLQNGGDVFKYMGRW
jgi:hypothetical protein